MRNSDRYVTIDHAEIPNPTQPPVSGSARKIERSRLDWRVYAVLVCLTLAPIGLCSLAVWPVFEELQYTLLDAIRTYRGLIVLTLGIVCVVVLYNLLDGLNKMIARFTIVRLQNDQPMPVRHLESLTPSTPQLLALYYSVLQAEATNPSRNWTNYSPSVHLGTQGRGTSTDAPAQPLSTDTAALTQYADKSRLEHLRAQGHIIRSGNSFMIGYDPIATPVYIEGNKTSFIGIAGQARYGKTTTALFLAAQAAMLGHELIICDPHGTNGNGLLARCKGLKARFLRGAVTPEEITEAFLLFYNIGRSRIDAGIADDAMLPQVWLICDEFTSLILRGVIHDRALELLTSSVIEFPKAGLHGVLNGHDWSSKLLGPSLGSVLRRAITHKIVHRSDPKNAEFLLPNSALARQAASLDAGQAILWGDAVTVVTVPYIGQNDIEYAAQALNPVTIPPLVSITQLADTKRQEMTLFDRIILLLQSSPLPMRSSDVVAALSHLGVNPVSVTNALTQMTNKRLIIREGVQGSYTYTHAPNRSE